MHVVKNDIVEIIAGDEAGKTGKILAVFSKKDRLLVEGVNYINKHVRPSQKNPQGGRVQKEAPIAASSVLVVCTNKNCAKYNRGVRTRIKQEEGKSKVRVCYKCGHAITAETEV
ncbi:MAG: 50S ribosomal protein L24 [Candidatus Brocadiales bacterium]